MTVLLLAGGRSRRFGRDKRLEPIGGEPLIARTYAVARVVAQTWVLVADAADAAALRPVLPDAHFVPDAIPGAGPLAALASALVNLPTPAALLVAADLVELDGSLLAELARATAAADSIVVPEDEGRLQVACAGYPRSLATAAAIAVAEGQRSLMDWVQDLAVTDPKAVRVIPPEVWRAWSGTAQPFRNVNEPSDLAG
jgi:molybdopterin-guanine dinucleotide biosynthesis protein A